MPHACRCSCASSGPLWQTRASGRVCHFGAGAALRSSGSALLWRSQSRGVGAGSDVDCDEVVAGGLERNFEFKPSNTFSNLVTPSGHEPITVEQRLPVLPQTNSEWRGICFCFFVSFLFFLFFVASGFWLLWPLAFVAFGFRGFRGFCGFWLLWLWLFGLSIYLSIPIYLSIYLSFFLSFGSCSPFSFCICFSCWFRCRDETKQGSKQASKHELLTFGSGVLLGGALRPPPTPPAPRNLHFIPDTRACDEINILR